MINLCHFPSHLFRFMSESISFSSHFFIAALLDSPLLGAIFQDKDLLFIQSMHLECTLAAREGNGYESYMTMYSIKSSMRREFDKNGYAQKCSSTCIQASLLTRLYCLRPLKSMQQPNQITKEIEVKFHF